MMVISRTPYRISFFGGGTDYPHWYKSNKGHVISTSIDKYVYISCRNLPPFFKHNIRLVYSKIEETNSIKNLIHVSAKSVLKNEKVLKNIEIHYDGDLPARSGIGSSSAFTVGLIYALTAFKNKSISKKKLAKKSIFVEQKIIKENVGSQDQIATAYGGFNYINFKNDLEFSVKKINLEKKIKEKLESQIMLFHTGKFRTAENISKTYINKLIDRSKYLYKIYDIVKIAKSDLKNMNIDNFGYLLNETWHMKKNISNLISNSYIDEIYKEAIMSGALGGKLLGAGGGGFIMFLVPKNKQQKIKNKFKKLLHVPIKFENHGAKIIYNSN